MKWTKGQSGNPSGRKPGTGKVERIRAAIAKDIPDILQAMSDAAKSGDVAAGKALLDRVCPPLKPIDAPVTLPLPDGSLADVGRAILAALSAGALSPSQAAGILAGLGTLAKVIEIGDLDERIAALEEHQRLAGPVSRQWFFPAGTFAPAPVEPSEGISHE